MGGRWLYSWCFVRCCLQELFKIARSTLVKLPSSFFSIRLVSVHAVHPYGSIDTTAALKKLHFILSVRSDFHMTIAYRKLSMPLLVACRCRFWLMRHCFLGRWTCQLVYPCTLPELLWKCGLFAWSTYIPFCVHWHRGKCLRWLIPDYAVVYLPGSLCHQRSRCRF